MSCQDISDMIQIFFKIMSLPFIYRQYCITPFYLLGGSILLVISLTQQLKTVSNFGKGFFELLFEEDSYLMLGQSIFLVSLSLCSLLVSDIQLIRRTKGYLAHTVYNHKYHSTSQSGLLMSSLLCTVEILQGWHKLYPQQ